MSPIEALTARHRFAVVDENSLDAFLSSCSEAVLFFPGDSDRLAESADVAVILPELLKQFGGRLTPAVAGRASERALQRRFCFNAFPALVFLRDDGYLGVVTRVLDWRDYVTEITAILAREPSAPPPFRFPDGCAASASPRAPSHSGDRQ
jgi:hydrogenase-1 operon protein HyaE